MRRTLIVKDPKAKIYYRDTALEVVSLDGSFVIGFEQIKELYLHQDISVDIKTVLQIARHVSVTLIDKRGYFQGEVNYVGKR